MSDNRRNRFRIGMVLLEPFPEDIRVEKEASNLAKKGYEIYLLCLGREGEPAEERVGEIYVRRIMPTSKLTGKIDSSIFLLTLKRPFWKRKIGQFIYDFHLDALHVHDLPLCGTGLKVARKRGLFFIADFHENYPYGLQLWEEETRWRDIVKRPFKALKRWLKYESEIVESSNATIVDSPEFKSRLVYSGLPEDKIEVVRNTIALDLFDEPGDFFKDYFEGKFVIVYLGVLSPQKGLSLVVEALPQIVKRVPNAVFFAVGRGYDRHIEGLKNRAVELGVGENLEFHARIPHRSIFSVLKAADIAILHLKYNIDYRSCSPHKLFEYMAAGLPVVVSPAESVARIVESEGIGYVVGYEPTEMAEAIVKLATDDDLRHAMGEAGKAAVKREYNWENDGSRLVELYDRILENKGKE